ncbi:MAG: cyclic nucleotide-binding domain-containing protein, partial [Cyclobacteriaceae bacterium]|nr:cyclic nucleotide-binding domain-containing protein [Cyclobacteriaceae bacterium]
MKDELILDFLIKQVGLFKILSDKQVKKIVAGSRVQSYEYNEAVVRFGEDATFYGVLLEGALSVSVIGEGGLRKEIGQLKTGDTFGDMVLMSGDKNMIDLIAQKQSQVLRIPVALFQSAIMTEPAAVNHISKTITKHIKNLMADPDKAKAAFQESDDPYGLQLKGERPEKIIVINCGSSSLKYSFFDSEDETNVANGQIERIGIQGTRLVHKGKSNQVVRDLPGASYEKAFEAILNELVSAENGVI